MTLRFKFTIFFSLLISFVFISAVTVIYYWYNHTREQDFNERLKAQAVSAYSRLYNQPVPRTMQRQIDESRPAGIIGLTVLIFDRQGKLLYASGASQFSPSAALLSKLAFKQTISFDYDRNSGMAIRRQPNNNTIYTLAYGYDQFGYARLSQLRAILLWVTVGGIIIITVLAFFLVKQVTRPITELSAQMQKISESNLKERVKVKSGRVNYEQRQVATQFNAMLERLETAFELQRSFVHHASHELRTPLATMLAQTELALRKEITLEEAKKVLESLKEDQQEMVELTNSLLLISQYERVTLSPDWPVLRLDEVLYDTLSLVKRMLPNVNVSIEFAIIPDDELFLSIRGNDSLIRSAFRNLIKNAWLYSDNKSVAVTIDATNTEIFLFFDNTGKVLEPSEQERLFIPFFRASNSVQKKGFGLGLNIIQRIVSLHKGSIEYSVYNGLNRFTLSFPKVSS